MLQPQIQDALIPRLICDEMLQKAGRWLRAAGYDVFIPDYGQADNEIVQYARDENRILITRDRKINEYRNAEHFVLLIQENYLNEQLREISNALNIDWLYKPFSRCMICNTELEQLDLNQWYKLPEDIQEKCEVAYKCPGCERIYWPGTHVDRMIKQLRSFNRGQW